MIRTERTISDYDRLMDPIRKARQEKSGNQPGDPAKAADGKHLRGLVPDPATAPVVRRVAKNIRNVKIVHVHRYRPSTL